MTNSKMIDFLLMGHLDSKCWLNSLATDAVRPAEISPTKPFLYLFETWVPPTSVSEGKHAGAAGSKNWQAVCRSLLREDLTTVAGVS